MGLLDDAIREHLDLKRRLGGDPEDIKRMEREALGPVRRQPTAPEARFEDEPGYEPYEDEPEAASSVGAPPSAPTSYDAPFDEADYDDDSAFFDEQPTQMHQAEAQEEHEHRRFGLFGRKSPKHEQEDPVEREPHDTTAEHEPDDPDFERTAADSQASESDYEYPIKDDFEDDDPFAREDRGQALAPEEEQRPEPPSLAQDDAPPPRRPRFTEPSGHVPAAPEDPEEESEPDDADLRAADTAERAPREPEDWDDKTQLFAFDDDEPEDEPEAEEQKEDVLEGTPDFLQDTPDHDRLWFEQKPPRDFDFGS